MVVTYSSGNKTCSIMGKHVQTVWNKPTKENMSAYVHCKPQDQSNFIMNILA